MVQRLTCPMKDTGELFKGCVVVKHGSGSGAGLDQKGLEFGAQIQGACGLMKTRRMTRGRDSGEIIKFGQNYGSLD